MSEYNQILDQIKNLQVRAESVKRQERAPAVNQIKQLMQQYDLTAEDLGFSSKRRRGAGARKAAGGGLPAKYRSPTGQTWSGRGPTPKWLQAAVASGKRKEDFAV